MGRLRSLSSYTPRLRDSQPPLAGITHAAILDESMSVPNILSKGSMDMLPTFLAWCLSRHRQ